MDDELMDRYVQCKFLMDYTMRHWQLLEKERGQCIVDDRYNTGFYFYATAGEYMEDLRGWMSPHDGYSEGCEQCRQFVAYISNRMQ